MKLIFDDNGRSLQVQTDDAHRLLVRGLIYLNDGPEHDASGYRVSEDYTLDDVKLALEGEDVRLPLSSIRDSRQ